MGNKKKKSSGKKRKDSNKVKKKLKQDLKYKTRREFLLSLYDEELLDLWFGDDQTKREEFSKFLLRQEELYSESSYDDLTSDKTYYEEKYDKLRSHKCHSIRDIMNTLDKLGKTKRKIKKGKRYRKLYKKKDLGIATYLNSDRYKKTLLSKTKYRKELSAIAKRERKELDEMRRLGIIRSKDPDKELDKLLKANKSMDSALSDAYIQKHFIQ